MAECRSPVPRKRDHGSNGESAMAHVALQLAAPPRFPLPSPAQRSNLRHAAAVNLSKPTEQASSAPAVESLVKQVRWQAEERLVQLAEFEDAFDAASSSPSISPRINCNLLFGSSCMLVAKCAMLEAQ